MFMSKKWEYKIICCNEYEFNISEDGILIENKKMGGN